ncbi:Malto-oligosyltrehalose trehalohydrolase [Caulifigura coniformis]|uniref:Malto-oligosyltrehalose trehalohydrolase n=1 Tax=Caulifigura coniformis TaxID=2527983 RepID=A0A517SA01_9PLAN|nr:malto-oligosyltrehalose trehalohydrolase [Caulifigura coniformis]QDT52957.1 Malto-oligosyltrehalose trehalohydrolase [Caulifigura coniformis]
MLNWTSAHLDAVRSAPPALPLTPIEKVRSLRADSVKSEAIPSARVWAPGARDVQIIVDGDRRGMQADSQGWWVDSGPGLGPGSDYAFVVDGEGPYPDPRSQWQPNGPHRASRVVDHSAFRWTDTRWQAPPLSSAIIYELHIGTFTPGGTFDAAIERLDHLVELGVTHVEVMPVAEFQGDYGWGYDGVSLYAPHQTYGGPDGFKRFIDACHARGLAVLLDVVYNHLGPSGNYLPKFGPYFTTQHHTPWGAALNFDGPRCVEVRRFVIDNALMWLRDYHLDGLRIDAVHAIVDLSAVHLLEELTCEVDSLQAQLGRHFVLIAESDLNDPRIVRPTEIGGFGLDAQWCDDIHHALHSVLTGEREGYYADFGSLDDLATAMRQPYVYAGRHSSVRERIHGRAPEGLSASRFVAFLQNHDQLGNRARGERIGHLVGDDRSRIGAALILLSPYVPMLFQGEEWAASSPFQYFVDFHDEPHLAEAVKNGRAREFGSFGWKPDEVPDPTAPTTLADSRLKWEELDQPKHAGMLEWYRALIQLRRAEPAFTSGRLDLVDVRHDAQNSWLVVNRNGVLVVCNFASEERSIPLGGPARPVLLASRPGMRFQDGAVVLPAESVAVLGRPSTTAR